MSQFNALPVVSDGSKNACWQIVVPGMHRCVPVLHEGIGFLGFSIGAPLKVAMSEHAKIAQR
jgi:hypothetical protein